MTAPKFIAGRQVAVILGAMQVGYLFIANDHLAEWRPSDGVGMFIGAGILEVAITVGLWINLQSTARSRGYSHHGWGSMAMLSLIGVATVYCLPNRTMNPARGFPV